MLLKKLASLTLAVESKDVDTASGRLEKFTKEGEKAEKATGKLKTGFGGLAKGVVALTAALGVSASIQRTITDYRALGRELKNVESISSQTEQQFKQTSRGLLEFAAASGDDALEATRGLYQAISAGVNEDGALDFLKQASQTAQAGAVGLETAVDGLTNVLNSYKLEASEAERVSDSLLTTVKLGKTTFEELSANMSKATVSSANLGVSYNELLAQTAQITKLGTNTSEAFTQQKALLTSLIRPTEELAIAYETLGIESARAAIESEGYVSFLGQIAEAFEGQDAGLVKALGSTEAYAALLATTGENGESVVQILKDIENGIGTTARAADTQSGTWERAMNRMKNSSLLFFDSLESKYGVLEKLTSLVNGVAAEMTSAATGIQVGVSDVINAAGDAESKIASLLDLQDKLQRKQEFINSKPERESKFLNPLSVFNPNSPSFFRNERPQEDADLANIGTDNLSGSLKAVTQELEKQDQFLVNRVGLLDKYGDLVAENKEKEADNVKAIIEFNDRFKEHVDDIKTARVEREALEEASAAEKQQEKLRIAKETLALEKENGKLIQDTLNKFGDSNSKAIKDLERRKTLLTDLQSGSDDVNKDAKFALDSLNKEIGKLKEKKTLTEEIKESEEDKKKILQGTNDEKEKELDLSLRIKNATVSEDDFLFGSRPRAEQPRQRGSIRNRDNSRSSDSIRNFGQTRVATVRESSNEIAELYKTEEEKLQETYDRRKETILNSTQLTMDEKAEIIERMDAEINRGTITRTQEAVTNSLSASADFLGNLGQLVNGYGKKGFEASKALAIASTTISTYQSAVDAYKSTVGLPGGAFVAPIAAASAVAFGLAQINQIRSQEYRGFNTGGILGGNRPAGDAISFQGNTGEMVFNKNQQEQLFQLAQGNVAPNNTGNTKISIENNYAQGVSVRTEEREDPETRERETRVLINRIRNEFAKDFAEGRGPMVQSGHRVFGNNRGKG